MNWAVYATLPGVVTYVDAQKIVVKLAKNLLFLPAPKPSHLRRFADL